MRSKPRYALVFVLPALPAGGDVAIVRLMPTNRAYALGVVCTLAAFLFLSYRESGSMASFCSNLHVSTIVFFTAKNANKEMHINSYSVVLQEIHLYVCMYFVSQIS